MTVDFFLEALQKALSMYGAPEILNTDQESQFTSEEFTSTLLNVEIKISMDGVGRATDNICIERFWRSIKYENIYLNAYENIKVWDMLHPGDVYGAIDELSTYSQQFTKRNKNQKKRTFIIVVIELIL